MRSRQEKIVERDLLEDGFEVYLPKVRKLKQWSDRRKWVDEPLFPGYCFVRVSEREMFPVLQHDAVVKYVSFGGRPSEIRDYQIESIKRILGENIDYRLTNRNFRPGEIVEIGVGPMTGLKAEVVKVSGRKKLIVRLQDIIGSSMVVNLPAAFVQV